MRQGLHYKGKGQVIITKAGAGAGIYMAYGHICESTTGVGGTGYFYKDGCRSTEQNSVRIYTDGATVIVGVAYYYTYEGTILYIDEATKFVASYQSSNVRWWYARGLLASIYTIHIYIYTSIYRRPFNDAVIGVAYIRYSDTR